MDARIDRAFVKSQTVFSRAPQHICKPSAREDLHTPGRDPGLGQEPRVSISRKKFFDRSNSAARSGSNVMTKQRGGMTPGAWSPLPGYRLSVSFEPCY